MEIAGTNPSKNFIGTRDAQPLVFRVNNQKAGYLDYSDLSKIPDLDIKLCFRM
jgi:hypothetical protein